MAPRRSREVWLALRAGGREGRFYAVISLFDVARIFCGGAGTNTSTSAAICRTRKIQKNRATTDALEKRRVRVRNLCAPGNVSLNGADAAPQAQATPLSNCPSPGDPLSAFHQRGLALGCVTLNTPLRTPLSRRVHPYSVLLAPALICEACL
jgi:hypothetical protein